MLQLSSIPDHFATKVKQLNTQFVSEWKMYLDLNQRWPLEKDHSLANILFIGDIYA